MFDGLFKWAQSRSLWILNLHHGCCADEVLNMSGPRYDVERFGCQMVTDAAQADVLMISGCISIKAAPYLREVYDQMRSPKWVIAIGSCANSGGFFADGFNDQVVKGATEVVPVDVFISGCPPRPEAIMNGILALQEKIYGS